MTIYDPEDQAERRHLETRLHHLIPLDDAVSLQTRPQEHSYSNSRAGGGPKSGAGGERKNCYI